MLRRCATLVGCAAETVTTLAAGQLGACRSRLDGKFVYWSTATAVMALVQNFAQLVSEPAGSKHLLNRGPSESIGLANVEIIGEDVGTRGA